jgi:hypothetical protein
MKKVGIYGYLIGRGYDIVSLEVEDEYSQVSKRKQGFSEAGVVY